VSLTGLGAPSFDASIQGLLDVYALFATHVSRDSLKVLGSCSKYGDHTSLDILNRYFTSVANAAAEKAKDFTKEVDPFGILSNLQTSNYIHTQSNKVDYFVQQSNARGDMR
jgi:hypothetical protein